MRRVSLPGWEALLFGAIIAVFGGVVLGGVVVVSGFYNVGASVRHFDITNDIIRLALRRSVATHSIGIEPPPDLSDERLALLGARHFALGCASCHASPVSTQNPIATEMYPAAPPLSDAVEEWSTQELFWIVKYGLKFTGMPAFPGRERDEEVWALVAFLKRLPGMDADSYAEMADIGRKGASGAERFDFGLGADDMVATCDACHGGPGAGPVHPLAPPLAGQKPDYLRRALTEYARNRRQSGMMEPLAAGLGSEAIQELARYYGQRRGVQSNSPGQGDAQAVYRGQAIARGGVPGDDIPACLSCHSAATSGQFPRLEGLSAEYIATQLALFGNGIRSGTTYAAIMAPVARRLSRQQIEDVAAYFASRAPPQGVDESAATGAAR